MVKETLESKITPITLVERASLKTGKTEEKTVGSSGLSTRQAPNPLTKRNRKKFNRLFRDKVKIGGLIELPDEDFGIYEGHMQGRGRFDKKVYFVQYSRINNFDLDGSQNYVYRFPEKITFKDGVYNIGYLSVAKPKLKK